MRREYVATLASIERPVHLRIQVATPGYDGAVYRLTLDDANGLGFVALNAPHWSASYFWPARGRGTIQGSGSLLAFLLRCDVSYVAGKLGVSDDFDAVATERAVKVELWRGNRSRYREILRDCPPDFDDAAGWDRWLDRYSAAGYDRGLDVNAPWERFAPIRVIRPDFEIFYRVAWPLLREQRARIESELYPQGIPGLPRAA